MIAASSPVDCRLTSFFDAVSTGSDQRSIDRRNSGGGFALLHQHLFWFYSHPAVYIMILPAMGMVSDILAVFARKPIFGYRPMVYAMAGIAFLGFIVWAHHMFQSGMNPTLGTTFAVSTMFIAVPIAIKTFNWLGTLWGGNIRFTVPMCNAHRVRRDVRHRRAVGHLHGLAPRSTCTSTTPTSSSPTFTTCCSAERCSASSAAIYFWYPKMFGRMMNETLGKIHFWLSFIFFNGTFFAMHILGIAGMPRRVADYMNYPHLRALPADEPVHQHLRVRRWACRRSSS